jgi:deoxyribodipyrimidine photolyase
VRTALVLFNRDLRVHDNPALSEAAAELRARRAGG